MKREWKPGDVALVRFRLGHPYFRCIRGLSNDCWWDDEGVCVGDREVLSVHPLVVLDPEGREQQDHLRDLIRNHGGGMVDGQIMQAALREFANPKPPKPDEPTGLGAVVIDEDGNEWVRHERVALANMHWSPVGGTTVAKWQAVNAVRVLSEGVQP